MKPKHRRLLLIVLFLSSLGLGSFFILSAFQDNLVFFYTPSDLQEKTFTQNQRLRVGGLVKKDSLKFEGDSVTFIVTDQVTELPVHYTGILPDLFREGQGVVAEGIYHKDSTFQATSVLAKHDENYMPPEVAKNLKDNGLWQHAE